MPFTSDATEAIIPWVIEFRLANGQRAGQIQVREVMTIGRGEGAGGPDIDLTPFNAVGMGVSRRHAAIIARGKFLRLRDLNSTNGTYLNNISVESGQDIPLQHGDVITLGDLAVQIIFAVLPPNSMAHPEDKMATLSQAIFKGSGRHIWVIEDDNDVAEVYRFMLEEHGYRVLVLNSFQACINALETDIPSAMILDLMLEADRGVGHILDGLNALHAAMAARQLANLPLVVVSGMPADSIGKQALHAGASAYLQKPVRIDVLLNELGGLMEVPDHP
ncbi:MAG: FHA domain-containing protein [Phototrophicaceae bacterium]|jgi:CheY-like chemotaxis protein